ncbi:MAG: DNA repair protein RecO [Flavobacteriales bacterium]
MIRDRLIVLHKFPFKNGFIVDAYSQKHGKISFLLPSRTSKANPQNYFQSLFLLEVEYRWRENSTFQFLKSSRLIYIDNSPFTDPVKTIIQLFLADFLRHISFDRKPELALFDFFEHCIQLILMHPSEDLKDLPCFVLSKSSSLLGFHIDLNTHLTNNLASSHEHHVLHLEPEHRRYLQQIEAHVFDKSRELNSKYSTRTETFDWLYWYFCYYLDQFKPLKSYDVLKQIFH